MDAAKQRKNQTAETAYVLQSALAHGLLDMDELTTLVDNLHRRELLAQHPYKIWQGNNGQYMTYVNDKSGKRMIRRRKTLQELENYLAAYYEELEEKIYLEDIFQAWSSEKLRFGEIQKQSYDRYVNDLSRHAFTPAEHPRDAETFSDEEQPAILEYLHQNEDIWNLALLLQFQTGMRVGEVTALKPEDIADNCIHVHRTEYKYKDETGSWQISVKDQPKTEAGCRDIILPPQARETLTHIRVLNGGGEYLFMNNGKRIRGNTLNKRLSAICSKLGLKHHSSHKIRKTYGTALLDSHVDDSFVAEQMEIRM